MTGSTTTISLIRGINVSGQKKLPMASLREALEAAGLESVRTYIQSGNVLCKTPMGGTGEAGAIVRATIAERFGYEVEVITVTPAELRAVLVGSPFADRTPAEETGKLGYAFLSKTPDNESIDTLRPKEYAPDELVVVGRVAYLLVTSGFGKSKLSTNYIEKSLGVRATMRNHRTVERLIGMAEAP